jgi:hypothetical protein
MAPKKEKCTTCGNAAIVTLPLCTKCTAEQVKVRVYTSIVPRAGFGLFVTADVAANTKLGYYTGKEITKEEARNILNSTDDFDKFRSNYLFEFEGMP